MQDAESVMIAMAFAAALDRSDFAAAAEYLSPDCRYVLGNEVLIGPEAIIASYRKSDEWGKRALDRVIYESEVTQDGDRVRVLYIDRITHRGVTHVYRSYQFLWLDESGKITKIVSEELPGERERLDQFFEERGLKRD